MLDTDLHCFAILLALLSSLTVWMAGLTTGAAIGDQSRIDKNVCERKNTDGRCELEERITDILTLSTQARYICVSHIAYHVE